MRLTIRVDLERAGVMVAGRPRELVLRDILDRVARELCVHSAIGGKIAGAQGARAAGSWRLAD